jgi:mannose-6-phosphate isomerase-like protein (cupin superfamily)
MNTISRTDGDRADFPSLGTRYLLRSEVTGGRFALIEHEIPPRALAAPTHEHQHEDEYSFVLEGRVGVLIGDEETVAGPGELVVKPRGVPHAFWNAGDEPARLLELISPGGFERYFEEMAPHLAGPGPPDAGQLLAIRGRYGLEMDMESIGPLVERHGLRGR